MGTRPERPRGAMVTTIETDVLSSIVRRALVVTHGLSEEQVQPIKVWKQYLATHWDDEKGYEVVSLINEEGVGYTSDEMGRVTVLYHSNEFGASGWIDIHRRVVEKCLTKEVVDLADVIRTFGDRLENNHYLWYSRLTRK